MAEQLVTVARYSTAFEARLAKAELEAFDLDAVLADEETVDINWLWSNAIGGVKLRVRESDCAEARSVLAMESAEVADPAVSCPVCGNADTRYCGDRRGSFLTWLLLGVPVIPALRRRVCDSCGHKWKP